MNLGDTKPGKTDCVAGAESVADSTSVPDTPAFGPKSGCYDVSIIAGHVIDTSRTAADIGATTEKLTEPVACFGITLPLARSFVSLAKYAASQMQRGTMTIIRSLLTYVGYVGYTTVGFTLIKKYERNE